MKKIIYLLIDLLILGASIAYFVLKGKKVLGQSWDIKNIRKTLVLGSGPSLKLDIKKVQKERDISEIYVLNYFALTQYFYEIKPEYYGLTDRIFWSQNVTDSIKEDNEKLFNHLDQVDWKMNLICSENGYKWLKKRLEKNENIRISKITSVNVEFKNELINLFALNYNITTPHFINGLIMTLWHAIYQNKKEIEIYGADFSMFKEYFVDQKTNELYSSASHFYKNTKAQENPSHKYPNEKKKMLHNRLYQQWSGFYQMYLLSRLAEKKDIKITNLSSNSFLDCFERIK